MGTKRNSTKKQNNNKQESQTANVKINIHSGDYGSNLFAELQSTDTPEASTEDPISGLDEQVEAIFKQASAHREKLLTFFIGYTIGFTIFVIILIAFQAFIRAFIPGKENLEVIPYWALNLLLAGMFGQFIALLTIVTKKVWQLEKFFEQATGHHTEDLSNHTNKRKETK